MNTTLSATFVKRANDVMNFMGMNINAHKRECCYGTGERINLIFELDMFDDRLDYEDMRTLNLMCPPTFIDNEKNEIYFVIDCVPIYISKVDIRDIENWERGLTEMKRYLKKRGF